MSVAEQTVNDIVADIVDHAEDAATLLAEHGGTVEDVAAIVIRADHDAAAILEHDGRPDVAYALLKRHHRDRIAA